MHPLAMALNIFFSAFVLITIVGGLVWAVLSSRSDQPTMHLARTETARPDGPMSDRRPSAGQSGGGARDPAVAV